MTRQERKSAMEEMLASIREAIHEETAHQTVGLHAPMRVRAPHEAPALRPDNDQIHEINPPGFLKPLSEDAPETEWVDAADFEERHSPISPNQPAKSQEPADTGLDREDVGSAPFAPRKKLLEKGLPSVGGIMSGRTPPPAEVSRLQTSTGTADAEAGGDAMFDSTVGEEAWWPDRDLRQAEKPEEAAADTIPADDAPGATEPLVSPQTGELAARAFDMLRQELALPEDLRSMTEEMLRPMLREWLDANLPELVERLVREEIARIAHGAPSRRMR